MLYNLLHYFFWKETIAIFVISYTVSSVETLINRLCYFSNIKDIQNEKNLPFILLYTKEMFDADQHKLDTHRNNNQAHKF